MTGVLRNQLIFQRLFLSDFLNIDFLSLEACFGQVENLIASIIKVTVIFALDFSICCCRFFDKHVHAAGK